MQNHPLYLKKYKNYSSPVSTGMGFGYGSYGRHGAIGIRTDGAIGIRTGTQIDEIVGKRLSQFPPGGTP